MSKLLAENEGHIYTLPDKTGNEPSNRYILKNATWIDRMPFEVVQELKEGTFHE